LLHLSLKFTTLLKNNDIFKFMNIIKKTQHKIVVQK